MINNLTPLNDLYGNAPDTFNVPDGKYTVQIIAARYDNNKEVDHGNRTMPCLEWELKILSGKHEGFKIYKNNYISSHPACMSILKRELKICDLILDKLDNLPNYTANLINKKIEIKVITKESKPNVNGQTYTNINIRFLKKTENINMFTTEELAIEDEKHLNKQKRMPF